MQIIIYFCKIAKIETYNLIMLLVFYTYMLWLNGRLYFLIISNVDCYKYIMLYIDDIVHKIIIWSHYGYNTFFKNNSIGLLWLEPLTQSKI